MNRQPSRFNSLRGFLFRIEVAPQGLFIFVPHVRTFWTRPYSRLFSSEFFGVDGEGAAAISRDDIVAIYYLGRVLDRVRRFFQVGGWRLWAKPLICALMSKETALALPGRFGITTRRRKS